MTKLRVLCCGDRNWSDHKLIRRTLRSLGLADIECVIEGECRGVDLLSKRAARELHIPVLPFPADWTQHKKAAGPIRNKQMLDKGKPTLVLAFHDNIAASKGTANMIKQAQKRHIPVTLVKHT